MTHNELLDSFYSRSHENLLHQQLLEKEDYEMPVEEIKAYMVSLTEISLTECFNYLDNHPSIVSINTSELSQFGSLTACTDELCEVLRNNPSQGMTVMEIGQAPVYAKYMRAHNKNSWSRYGNNQAKTAHQLGLAFKNEHRWYLSCYGYAYAFPLLNATQQQQFLSRALLRNPFYAQILGKARLEEVKVSDYLDGLSASTQGTRSGSIARLLQICLDEMNQEGIKWYDILLPRFNARTKTVTTHVLHGTYHSADHYGINEEYFDGGVPLYTVKAACGYFVEHEVPEQEGWLDLSSSGVRTNSKDFFVVHAKGDSMLPKIKDGDLCLFKWYQGEALYDTIVLTQCREYDSDYESSYTIKSFHQNTWKAGEPRTVSLQPLNKEKYHPILLSEDDVCNYKTIGVFVKVLK